MLHSMRRNLVRAKVAVIFGVLALPAVITQAVGTADTDISASVDNVTATWAVIKTALIAIGVFVLCYRFFKRLGRA